MEGCRRYQNLMDCFYRAYAGSSRTLGSAPTSPKPYLGLVPLLLWGLIRLLFVFA
jgi:hypothetical protein